MSLGRILRTNHTGFAVSDLKQAATFFRDLLGFTLSEPVRQSGEAVARLTGVVDAVIDIQFAYGYGCTVELQHYVNPDGKRPLALQPCDAGFAHIAFEVDDVEAIANKISAAGYAPISDPQVVPAGPRKGGKNLYVRGPDNIVIEFQVAPQGFKEPPRLS
jgi:catechol 2,3-dioxygenase-like lactoylglutathione lyase family enzyme